MLDFTRHLRDYLIERIVGQMVSSFLVFHSNSRVYFSFLPRALHPMPIWSFLTWHPNNIRQRNKMWKFSLCYFLKSLVNFFLLGSNILIHTLYSKNIIPRVLDIFTAVLLLRYTHRLSPHLILLIAVMLYVKRKFFRVVSCLLPLDVQLYYQSLV